MNASPTADPTPPTAPKPTPRTLAAALRAGALEHARALARGNQGEILRLEIDGHDLVVKQALGRSLLGRANRWTLTREARAYRRLNGVPGIARFHGFIDRRWLVLDHVESRPFRDSEVRPDFFDRLLALLREMHRRGVAHGDLKRKANLMIDPAGRPVLFDFGAAVVRREGLHPINHKLFNFLRQTDLNAWIKLKYGGYENLRPEDRALLKRSALERGLSWWRGRG